MIVEDDKDLQIGLKTRVEQEGFAVLVAGNGEECIDKIKNNAVDLVLLDMLMPKMDGMDALKKIRSELKNNLLIIILSNADDTTKGSEALSNQVYDYVIKSDETLEEVVGRIKFKLNL